MMMFGQKNKSQTGLTLAHTFLDQLHPTPEYAPAPQDMDLSNIFDFPNVMTTASNEDIPSLEDVFGL